MGLVSAVSTRLGAKLMAKGFVSKFLAKGVIGVSLVGNALLPTFVKKALHIEEIVEDIVEATPLYMDFEVYLLVGLIAFALFVTKPKTA